MAKKRFYGVAGLNGYGVYNDYNKVLEAKPYIKSFMIKGFPYYQEARHYAINTYKNLAYGSSEICGIYNIKRMNRFYYKNPIREQSIQDRLHEKNNDNETKTHIAPFTVNIKK